MAYTMCILSYESWCNKLFDHKPILQTINLARQKHFILSSMHGIHVATIWIYEKFII